MPQLRRSAFTRVEFLVTVAIVSTVVGLATCMVAKVREADARAKCQCHLKSIVLSCHNYDSTYEHLPPGLVGAPPDDSPNSTNFPNHGPLPLLLPFFESGSLFRQFVEYQGGPPVAGGMVFIN